jgi:uncharacterized integral membrane protein
MTSKNIFSSLPVDYASLGKRMLIGGAIALVLILVFIIPAIQEPKPDWSKVWMIRPLLVVPFAGAVGGACNYFLVSFGNLMGWNKALAYILSFIIFIFGLWIGTVLGLAGTLWN